VKGSRTSVTVSNECSGKRGESDLVGILFEMLDDKKAMLLGRESGDR